MDKNSEFKRDSKKNIWGELCNLCFKKITKQLFGIINYKALVLYLLLIFSIIFLVSAITITLIIPSTGDITTSNDSVMIEYNFSIDSLQELKFSWNGTNYSLYNNSLVLFYNFDNRSSLGENDTNIVGLSIYGYNATPMNGANYNDSGRFNGCYKLDGVNDFVNITFNPSWINQSHTISVWWKINEPQENYQNILFRNWSERIFIQSNGLAYGFKDADGTNNNEFSQVNPVLTNKWYNTVIVYDDNSKRKYLYVDGILIGNHSQIGISNDSGYTFILGSRITADFFNGTIDEFKLWNESLSSNIIQENYYSSLVKYNSENWTFSINQSLMKLKNYSNSLNPVTNITYNICILNTTDETCSNSNQVFYLVSVPDLIVNFSHKIGSINAKNAYGVTTKGYYLSNSPIYTGSNSSYSDAYNSTEGRMKFYESGMDILRIDIPLGDTVDENLTFDVGTSINQNMSYRRDTVRYAYEQGYKVILIMSHMPTWLANTSTNCSTKITTCPPTNHSRWGNLTLAALNNVTENGKYVDSVIVEVWNEPNLQMYWMNGTATTNVTRSIEYNRVYNATYTAIKSSYPNVPIIGPTVTSITSTGTSNFIEYFLSNFSSSIDGFSFHEYWRPNEGDIYNWYDYLIGLVKNNLTNYNVNCNIYLDEIGIADNFTQTVEINKYMNEYTLIWLSVLNNSVSNNLSVLHYQFSELASYYLNPTKYFEYPYRWTMYSGTQLDNEIYVPFNVTKAMTHLCPLGGDTYLHSTDDNDIKILACHKNKNYGIVIVNSGNYSKNITLNLVNYTTDSIYNYVTGEKYTISGNVANINILDSISITNGVLFLSSQLDLTPPLLITSPKNNSISSTINYLPISINSSDENNISISINYDNSEVLRYRFGNDSSVGENDTFIYDWSQNGYNLNVNGNAKYNLSGLYSGNYMFDGDNDNLKNVDVLKNYSYPNGLTISTWIYKKDAAQATAVGMWTNCADATSDNTGWGIVYKSSSIQFQICRGNQFSYLTAQSSINANQTYLVTATYNNSDIAIYVDGLFQQSTTLLPVNITTAYNFTIGETSNGVQDWNGFIGETQIWNRSLSREEISLLYPNQSNIQEVIIISNQSIGSHKYKVYSEDIYGNLATLGTYYVNITDSTPPAYTTTPYNKTTTNQSVDIYSVTNESANYTLRITAYSNYSDGTLISNSTFSTIQDTWIGNLINSTTYYVNITAADISDNKVYYNFSFITASNPEWLYFSNFKFTALNSSLMSLGNKTAFNTSNLQSIEFANISFTVTSEIGFGDERTIYFTANGSRACSLGNKQDNTCYSYPNFIQVKNNTNTSTYNAISQSTRGDYILCTYQGNGADTQRNYSCTIDEHYNPNVFKHYPLNLSDLKWQTDSQYRINKNNIFRYEIDRTKVPDDATFYKLDIRINYTVGALYPTQSITAFACNSLINDTRTTPELSPYCNLIASKMYSDFQDDGTKFRAVYRKNLTDALGNISYIYFTSQSLPSKYYTIKTYKYLGEEAIRSEFSSDGGLTFTKLADGYESDLNINWFYNSSATSNVTSLQMIVEMEDSTGVKTNDSLRTLTWSLGNDFNLKPIANIIYPLNNFTLSNSDYINFTATDGDNNIIYANITINNGTTYSLFTYLHLNYSVLWDTTAYSNGRYNLTLTVCENATAELYCVNSTREGRLNNIYCGNGVCDSSTSTEDCASCPVDCGVCGTSPPGGGSGSDGGSGGGGTPTNDTQPKPVCNLIPIPKNLTIYPETVKALLGLYNPEQIKVTAKLTLDTALDRYISLAYDNVELYYTTQQNYTLIKERQNYEPISGIATISSPNCSNTITVGINLQPKTENLNLGDQINKIVDNLPGGLSDFSSNYLKFDWQSISTAVKGWYSQFVSFLNLPFVNNIRVWMVYLIASIFAVLVINGIWSAASLKFKSITSTIAIIVIGFVLKLILNYAASL